MSHRNKLVWGGLILVSFVVLLCTDQIFPYFRLDRHPSGHFVSRMTIGPETTVVTEPIDSEGYIDFGEAINRQFSQGIDPHNNRVVALLEATGPTPAGWQTFPPRFYDRVGVAPPANSGDYLVTLKDFLAIDQSLDPAKRLTIGTDELEICAKEPWQSADHPQIASWIEKNQIPLTKAILALQKPRYFHPVIDQRKGKLNGGIGNMVSLVHSVPKEMTLLLCCKAMLELGQKEGSLAKEDLLNCLTSLHAFKPIYITDLSFLLAMEDRLYQPFHQLLDRAVLSMEELQAIESVLESIEPFPGLCDLVDQSCRLMMLDEVVVINQCGALPEWFDFGLSQFSAGGKARADAIKKLIDFSRVNYNEILITINLWHDKIIADLKIADTHLRRVALRKTQSQWKDDLERAANELEEESKAWRTGPSQAKAMTRTIGLGLAQFATRMPLHAQEHLDQVEEKKRLLLTAVALAKYRIKTGQYPEKLSALVPDCIKALPADLFTERDPLYRKTADGGYWLYSVGPDRIDSGGSDGRKIGAADDIEVHAAPPSAK